MRVLIKYSFLFLAITGIANQAFCKTTPGYFWQQNNTDSVKRVQVYVYAKEKVLNYDSLFRAQNPGKLRFYTDNTETADKKPVNQTDSQTAETTDERLNTTAGASSQNTPISGQKKPEVSSQEEQNAAFSHASKTDYLWIGVILIIAGIVLGIILGRTAYLVSVVGAVFIVLSFTVAN